MNSNKKILSFLTLLIILCSITPYIATNAAPSPVSPNIGTFSPTDDAAVSELNAGTNYGSYDYIAVGGEATDGHTRRSFILFDLSNIPPGSVIDYANLRLYMDTPPSGSRTLNCYRINMDPVWTEESITWNNQPSGVLESSTSAGTSASWLTLNVKTSVEKFTARDASAAPNFGWMLRDSQESTAPRYTMLSKEYSSSGLRPYIQVKYYPPHLEVSTGGTVEAGYWVKMTVYRKTYNNDPVTRGALNVKLSSTSTSTNKKFALTSGGTAITQLTIPDGSGSNDFYYYDDTAGTWTIKVWTDDYIYYVTRTYGDDSEPLVVTPGPLDRFAFDTISSPKQVAVSFPITITALDSFGNTVTSYTGTNSLSDTTGTINPVMTGAFVNGKWTGNVVINAIGNNVMTSTSGGGKTSQSNAFNVVAGPPAKLIITPPTLTVAAGVQYSSLTISLRDAHDFEATAITSLTVNLATTSPDGEFREVGTATEITSVTIPAGLGSALVDYYDIEGGTWTLTASAGGLTSGTSAVTVIPDTTPPVTTASVGSPKHEAGTTLYVGGTTGIELSATDDASGVKVTKYRIDGGSWNAYAGTFVLASYADGSHTMGYYSSDKAGNNETERTLAVILDKTAPLIETTEPSGTIIQRTRSVTFRVAVEETGSGVASVELFIDGASEGSMTMEDDAYTKTKEVTPGAHSWSVRAEDNVDNLATTPDIGFVLTIDDQPPTISNVVMAPSSPSWGEPIRVSATIDDALSSVQEATIYYSTNGGSSWSSVTMMAPMPPAVSYEGTIPTQMPMTKVQFYINASDNLGNTARSSTQEFAVEIPIWLYGAVGAIVVVSILAVAVRRRKPSLPPPPPPPPS